MPSSRGSSQPGIEPGSLAAPALLADSFPKEPPGKLNANTYSEVNSVTNWGNEYPKTKGKKKSSLNR